MGIAKEKLWTHNTINDLAQSPLGTDPYYRGQGLYHIVFDFLTCLLQPWSVCVEVVDPNAGGRHSLGHLI